MGSMEILAGRGGRHNWLALPVASSYLWQIRATHSLTNSFLHNAPIMAFYPILGMRKKGTREAANYMCHY